MTTVNVLSEKCDGCGSCSDLCPNDVFKVDGKCTVVNEKDCMACKICETACPKMAITVLE